MNTRNLPKPQRIGVLYNPLSNASVQLSVELSTYLEERGLHVWRGTSHDQCTAADEIALLDIMIALGGDGTALRAARIAVPHRIPVLTVALGRLNFLAEMLPTDLYHGLETLLDGGGWLDQRTLIEVSLHRQGRTQATFTALNEIVVSRGDISRIITVDVLVDEMPLTTYRADGVLVATATGSTAYALSAGGPILDPRSRALVLVPVAAHLTAVPSMVLHEDSIITLFIRSCRHATLSVDGRQNLPLYEGDTISARVCDDTCTFVRIHPQKQFYASLIHRLRRE